MTNLERMIKLTHSCHEGQMYGDLPYSVHLDRCVDLLQSTGCTDEDMLCAMQGHDLLEDTSILRKTIEDQFPKGVVRLISLITKDRADYDSYIASIIACHDLRVLILKLVDMTVNLDISISTGHVRLISKYTVIEPLLKLALMEKWGVKYSRDTRTMLKSAILKLNELSKKGIANVCVKCDEFFLLSCLNLGCSEGERINNMCPKCHSRSMRAKQREFTFAMGGIQAGYGPEHF